MSDASKPFAFSQFVPGFDFLRSLAGGSAAGAGAVPGMPTLSSWVAPTLSVEEVDKRIQELKTVQYWLEQNGHALKATIQALEVQKMTLSTLRGMNVRMEDIANAFTRSATTPAAAPAPREPFRAEPAPAPEPAPEPDAPDAAPEASAGDGSASKPAGAEAGVVDPLQWWGALTQQFQQIAASALQEASNLKMPVPTAPGSEAAAPKRGAASAKAKPAGKRPAARKKKAPARRSAGTGAAAPDAGTRRTR